jgi:hypothetical protein
VTTVAGSAPQRQARAGVVLAGNDVSNVVDWTIHARAFVVDDAREDVLRAVLDAATAFTDATGDRALVTFDPAIAARPA